MQRKYADQIEILVGGETDMCRPEWLEDVKRVAAQHDLEYLVGSVHHVRQMPIDYDEPSFVVAEKACGGTEAIFIAYFEQVAEMVAQLRPSIVGHFDLIRLFRQQQPLSPPIWAAIDKAIAAIVKHDCLVEINSSGLRKKLMAPYPHGDILKVRMERYEVRCRCPLNRFHNSQVMLDRGVKLILADDSHRTEQVAVCYAQVREYLQQHGVQEVYRLRRASDAAPGMAGTTVEAVKLESILDHPAWA